MIKSMYVNAAGMPDLVHHTAKHFLNPDESHAWDRVPRGELGATEALVDARELGRTPDIYPVVDPFWWWPPWKGFARQAHDLGYAPRYQLLIHLAGDPESPRWTALGQKRRVTEYLGFTLVVDQMGAHHQVVSAYYSPEFAGASDLPHLAPALRAFLDRAQCPLEAAPGVSAAENKP
jgi:hypothetical protein